MRGRLTFGTKAGADSRPDPVCRRPSKRVNWPEAPVVDGPRARPAVSAVRARGALDALHGATARLASVRGMPCGRWSS